MKTTLIILHISCLNIGLTFAQQKSIDTKKSIINWTGYAEIGSYAPAGTLNFKEGQVAVKDGKVGSAMLLIDMKSIQQSNADLVRHLKSADFFNVDEYPLSTIEITKIINGRAYGQLTIKDKTLPLICPVSIQTVDGTITIRGSLTMDRTKYGVIYNSNSFFANLGDHAIRNTVDVAFTVAIGDSK